MKKLLRSYRLELKIAALVGLLLYFQNATAADWFRLGGWQGAQSGMLIWQVNYAMKPDNVSFQQSSQLNYLYQNRYQMQGYLWRPWISRFGLGTMLTVQLDNIHNLSELKAGIIPVISSRLDLFPYSNFKGNIALNFTPTFNYSTNNDWTYGSSTNLSYTQEYIALNGFDSHKFKYQLIRNHPTKDESSYSANINYTTSQSHVKNNFSEHVFWNKQYNNQNSDTYEFVNTGMQHKFKPEFSGLITNHQFSLVDFNKETQSLTNTHPTWLFTGTLGYQYDEEYIDTSKVPLVSANYMLTGNINGARYNGLYTNLNIKWPLIKNMSMNSSISHSDSGLPLTRFNQSLSPLIQPRIRNKFTYAQTALMNFEILKTVNTTTSSLSESFNHGFNFTPILKNIDRTSLMMSQNLSSRYNDQDKTFQNSVYHLLGMSAAKDKYQGTLNITESRSTKKTDDIAYASQAISLSARNTLIDSGKINASLKFNINWTQNIYPDESTSSATSANIEYSHSNTMYKQIKNLSVRNNISLNFHDTVRELSYNGGMGYMIGSTKIDTDVSANYGTNYSAAITLKLIRLF